MLGINDSCDEICVDHVEYYVLQCCVQDQFVIAPLNSDLIGARYELVSLIVLFLSATHIPVAFVSPAGWHPMKIDEIRENAAFLTIAGARGFKLMKSCIVRGALRCADGVIKISQPRAGIVIHKQNDELNRPFGWIYEPCIEFQKPERGFEEFKNNSPHVRATLNETSLQFFLFCIVCMTFFSPGVAGFAILHCWSARIPEFSLFVCQERSR